jgi:hypothetical protein
MVKLKITLLCLCLINNICFSQAGKKKTLSFNISGKVTQTSAYCGGAEPTEEMMNEYRKEKPYAGKTFYVRKGNTNTTKEKVILSFKANENGKFSFQLPPGTYSIIQEAQVKEINPKSYNKKGSLQADATCLKNWWLKPYYILEIKDKDVTGLHFKFHHPCFISDDIPCIQYTGPMPP